MGGEGRGGEGRGGEERGGKGAGVSVAPMKQCKEDME